MRSVHGLVYCGLEESGSKCLLPAGKTSDGLCLEHFVKYSIRYQTDRVIFVLIYGTGDMKY